MTSRTIWPSVWLSLAGLLLLALPARAQSDDWTMVSFRSDITIHNDASITVTETIGAEFHIPKHGIFRTIPFRYPTDNTDSVSVPVSVESVTRDGEDEPFDTTIRGDDLEIKIGDADVTIDGRHQYEIIYTAKAAINFFDDHDELYWNVTGNDWDVPIGAVEAVARLNAQVDVQDLQIRCLTGSVGSTEENCETSVSDSAGGASSDGEPLTIVFGWPKGVVTKPENYDELRAAGTTPTGLAGLFSNPTVFWGFNIGALVVAVGWLIRRWMTHGRDPKGRGTIIAQYDPPAGLTPGEVGTLIDEQAQHRDVVAGIIGLAVLGYLTITETEESRALGFGKKKEYRLDRTKKTDTSNLKPHQVELLDGLFDDGKSVTLSELKGSFYTHVKSVQSHLYKQLQSDGYFEHNPSAVRIGYAVVGALIIGLSVVFSIGVEAPMFGVGLAGIATLIAAPFMPKRTAKGAEALWHTKGFKLFLEKAEKYRLQWQEREHIFETYLPYAMALGVAEQWSKTFEGIQQEPPGWYHGTPGAHFNSILLWSALSDFSTTSMQSFTPPAASGSSGFGGGGFSGGGFGGGGGGSW